MRPYESINPFTGELDAAFDFLQPDEADIILEKGHVAFQTWRKLGFAERGLYIKKLGELLREHADELAVSASFEMGKLLPHAKAEVLKSAMVCTYCLEEGHKVLEPKTRPADKGIMVEQAWKPLGLVLGIYPWNFPYWQVIRSAVPALMAGNTILVKPAPNVPASSIKLQELFDKAGFPEGVIQTIFPSDDLIAGIISDKRIAAVSLTGSERAGSAVGALAGKAIKPIVLELGGSDAFIIREDANINQLMEQAVFSRFQNNGQSCVAAKRYLVHESLYESFLAKLIEGVKNLKMGDPMDSTTSIGPLARFDLKELLASQVDDSIQSGARLVYQQPDIPESGFFYPPTILANIPEHARAYREEMFGPVLSLYSFKTDEDAVKLANATAYGLGCSIWTSNLSKAREMGEDIDSGMVYFNQIVKSDVRFPFGGCKNSGFGRELGEEGLKAFCQLKTTWFKEQ
ncbi:MAG: NAD-dependent succinate-semialdehyde dehydrogenase [Bacteroidetes bacterium]|nr:NAD-dependent succinate-semialdehyde dehydrogenase [Bacteroidota bacterium]